MYILASNRILIHSFIICHHNMTKMLKNDWITRAKWTYHEQIRDIATLDRPCHLDIVWVFHSLQMGYSINVDLERADSCRNLPASWCTVNKFKNFLKISAQLSIGWEDYPMLVAHWICQWFKQCGMLYMIIKSLSNVCIFLFIVNSAIGSIFQPINSV